MSGTRTRTLMTVLAAVGLAISAYLTYVHYAGIQPFCSGISDCERVQTSDWALLAGVPVALVGLLGYAAILVALRVPGEAGRLATAFFAFGGFGYSSYLTAVELLGIEAICQWCVVSAVLMTALAGLAALRVVRESAAAELAGA